MQARMSSAISRLVRLHPGETVVAVSHADPIKAAVASAAGTPLDLFQRLTVSPCSVSALAYGDAGPHVLTVNSTASLTELAIVVSEGYDLSDPDRITVGTVGPVGDRLFLLQCRQGPILLTLKMEKQQVAVVADYLARIVRDQQRPGHLPDELPLEEPAEPAWVVGHGRRLLRRGRGPGRPGHRGAGPRGRDRRHRPAVHLPRAGRRLRHPGHPAGRVGPSALPAVRIAPRPVWTRMPTDQRPPSPGGVTGWSPEHGPGLERGDRAARPPASSPSSGGCPGAPT